MFLGNDVIEFINKIINSNGSECQNKEEEYQTKLKNLKEFVKYLKLTKMTDQDTLKGTEKIIDCFPEIFKLKQKLGYFDVNTILEKEKDTIEKNDIKKAKQIIKVYEEKHYHHYSDNSSSSCGGSSTTTSRC